MNKPQSVILSESDFRAAISKQCGLPPVDPIRHVIRLQRREREQIGKILQLSDSNTVQGGDIIGASRPSSAEILDSPARFLIQDRDCDDACQHPPSDGEDRGDLRDDGRSDGYGESYAERNS